MQLCKRKHFEDNAKKESFWTKLIFKTKGQERDFVRALMRWINFMYFPLGGIPIRPTRQQVDEGMRENFYCTEHFYQRPSSLTVQSKGPFIKAKSTIVDV